MGSGSRNLLCKSSSSALLFLAPSFTSAQLRFNSFTPSKLRRMATQPSSSPSSLTTNDTASPSPSPSPSSTIDFLSLCHRLKTTKRAGWVKRGIKGPESISDHMYRMGLMALIAPDIPGIDPKEMIELWNEYEENSTPEAKIVKDFDKVEMILQALEYENGEASCFPFLHVFISAELYQAPAELYGLLLHSKQGKDLEEFFQSTAGDTLMWLCAQCSLSWRHVIILQCISVLASSNASGKFQTEVGKAWALEITSRRKER
ncbi:hypothetical protein POTOM_025796 [Populus tomentosa]|uniref:HD domain-containing protein n=1 Tax=Populus tomentosa TaxID=118781 RepID=A0A8X7ZJA6_POPTO|nr:hypothetical protein POTOM_025796 [Populus tomentosa]